MSIGLYDADFLMNPRHTPYNLQLMKLSTYFKVNKRELVSLITDLNKAPLYTEVYYFQNLESTPIDPTLSYIPNLKLMGRMFNNEYTNLGATIESCIPDTYIYRRLNEKAIVTQLDQTWFNTYQNGSHVKLSLDGKTLNPYLPELIITQRSHIIHDIHLEPEWASYFAPIKKSRSKFLTLAYPVIIPNLDVLDAYAPFYYHTASNYFILDFQTPQYVFSTLIQKYNRTFLSHCMISFGMRTLQGSALKQELIQVINNILYMKIHNKPCHFQYGGQWSLYPTTHHLAYLITRWANNVNTTKSFFEFYKSTKDARNVRVLRNIKEQSSDITKILNISPKALKDKGGKL